MGNTHGNTGIISSSLLTIHIEKFSTTSLATKSIATLLMAQSSTPNSEVGQGGLQTVEHGEESKAPAL